MAIYIGWIDADPAPRGKLTSKHGIHIDDVREALMRPARARAVIEDDEHGWHVVAVGQTADMRQLIASLYPQPPYEQELAESWLCGTARWLL